MQAVPAFATPAANQALQAATIERREPADNDVVIDIRYCGVCHSDLHTARNEWGGTRYPCVPGHEIVGTVRAIGNAVDNCKVGDTVAVGCMVDSCGQCGPCQSGDENFCEQGFIATYNSALEDGSHTLGGYSASIVVAQRFVLQVRHKEQLAAVAPLVCAGITTWSPLRHWQVGAGSRVGVVGLGGLGHMGVKLAHALGAEVVLYTTSPDKADDARRLGADDVVLSRDQGQMQRHTNRLDLILDTVAVPHDLDPLLKQLRRDGTLCLVGLPDAKHPAPSPRYLIAGRRSLSGSMIGGIRETQEMLDFCAEHGIVSDIEMIRMDDINQAYERMLRSDVKYRFVIDMQSLS